MTIYVVQPGDSLWAISQRFGVSLERIVRVNGLQGLRNLVVGQALVIPSTERAYTVRPGDSLYSIAQRFNVPVNRIAELNGITNPALIYPGLVLRIPELSKGYGYIEVNAYIEPSTAEREAQIVRSVAQYLTYISPFSYRVNADGSLNPIRDETIIQTARLLRAAPLMVITNFINGNFSTELGRAILTNAAVQQTLINNVIATMRAKGYYGLNIDFERLPPETRELYNNFLRRVVAALRPLNYPACTSLAPKLSAAQVGEWYEAHDYAAHGQIMDFVILMTYEWGWSGGPPLAVAPINQVRAVLDYAVSVIPRNKILMGMPLYGYNWTLPYRPGGGFAPRVSPEQAVRLAAQYGANIQYDQTAQSPFFNYYDERGTRHIVWFEDARSVRAKFLTVVEYGLRGVSYWELGSPFTQNWYVLNDMFHIVKVLR
ncbi:MAG: glycoside hydrolase family 18 protein [Clostridiales bacterium]|nr:glycoside hydrolase family 18 protein [Eubacteriales bacterium]MDH7565891.1 glycoside hydrolase family 18 protein [Clostridiales bacterium]